ncbi:hypothetical protein [uncultured Devosia sp.]|uniref:hypothetical protein n=1 Tax=uncultured Devosia sp. TaxID=211434 RepID=UPI0035C9F7DE
MATPGIAALFDAENVAAEFVAPVLAALATQGTVGTCRAVGDFSGNLLPGWISAAKAHGVELVLQPNLAKARTPQTSC